MIIFRCREEFDGRGSGGCTNGGSIWVFFLVENGDEAGGGGDGGGPKPESKEEAESWVLT